jgi:hypothetical protein
MTGYSSVALFVNISDCCRGNPSQADVVQFAVSGGWIAIVFPGLIAVALGGWTRRIQYQVTWLLSLAIIPGRRNIYFCAYFQ